jgi:hypothetical protein
MCSAAFWLAWPAFVCAVITEVTDLTMHQHPHRLHTQTQPNTQLEDEKKENQVDHKKK